MKPTPLLCTLPALIAIILSSAGCSTNSTPKQADTDTADATTFNHILSGPDQWPELTSGSFTLKDLKEQHLAANRETRNQLKTIVTLKKENVTLEQTIHFVRDTTGANIAINWPALELAGIERDALVTIHLTRVPAGKFLDLILDQASADAYDDDKAGFRVDEGVVIISTRRDLRADTLTRVYDIAWYLLPNNPVRKWLYRNDPRAKAFAERMSERNDLLINRLAPKFDLNDALSGTRSGGSSHRKNGLFGESKKIEIVSGPVEEQINHRLDELINLISTTVGDPDEWLDEESTLNSVQDKLVIKTTTENHVEVQALLTKLYQSQAQAFFNQARQLEVFLLLDEAEAFRLKQQYDKALSKVNAALAVDPGSAEAWAIHKVITETLAR